MKKVLFYACMMICLAFSADAQTPQYTCGTATGSNSIPLGAGTWADQRCQFLYLAGEFGTVPGGMAISKIYFRAATATATSTYSNFRVDIGQSNITTLSSTAWISGLTMALSVASFTVTSTAVDQWIGITLATPIPFDPTLSLIVDTRQTATTGPGFPLRNQTATGTRRAYALSAATAPTGSGTQRYDLGFDLISLAPCTAPPVTGTISASSVIVCQGDQVMFNLTGNSQGTGQTYQLQSATTATGTYTNVGSSNTIPALTATATTTLFYRIAVTCGSSTVNSSPIQVVVNPSLPGGNYTIDPAQPSSSTNFQTFTAAVNAIKCGITGPVVFNVASGTYNEQISIPQLNGSSNINRVTFKSATGNTTDVTLTYSATAAADNYVCKLNNTSFITFKNMTMTNPGTSFCRVIELVGTASNDSIINCRLTGATVASISTNMAIVYGDPLTGTNNTFKGNIIENGSAGILYDGTSTTVQTDGGVFDDNQFINQYYYSLYLYYTTNSKIRNNTITTNSTYTSWTGYRSYYGDGTIEVINNKISGPQGYGIYHAYSDAPSGARGIVRNNVITIGNGASTTAYGLDVYICSNQDVYNNSVNITSTSATGYAGYFYNNGAAAINNNYYNNSLKNSGGGYALFVYNPTYISTYDYNNLYTTGVKLVDQGTPATDYATLTDWRDEFGFEMNSISYDPGYMSPSDLHPDPANPASWSLNGRGIHIAGNNVDYDNNPRVTNRADGVPDIGAYEFMPTSTPPLAQATPLNPVAGTTQVFTFGRDTVASIEWPALANIPNSVMVRQYTGTIAPGLNTVSPTSYTYFYTDVVVPPGDFEFHGNTYYKDPWLGTISSEANMKLIKKDGSDPWIGYNYGLSSSNTTRNIIRAADLIDFGYFTGIDNGAVHSAIVKATPKSICPGGQTTLIANTGPGYTYEWKLNGSTIPGATGSTYVATVAGNYTVEITDANSTSATAIPVTINVILPPGATIYLSKAPYFCEGDSITLQANGGGGGLTYQWRLNGQDITNATASSYTAKTAGIYTVEVNNVACGSVSSATMVTIGTPQLYLGGDTAFCELKPLTLNAGYPGAKFTWSTGDTTQTIQVIDQAGDYWVKVDLGQNCSNTDTINVMVTKLPEVTGITYVQSGADFTFSASGVSNVKSYLWLLPNGGQDTGATIQYQYAGGPKEIMLIVYNECGSDTAQMSLTLGIGSTNTAVRNINLYPNPAQSAITLQTDDNLSFEEVTISNQVGQVLYRGSYKDSKKIAIDVHSYVNGNYVLRTKTSDGNIISKPFTILK